MATATKTFADRSHQSLLRQIGTENPEVLKVMSARHGDRVTVWTVVADFDRKVRDRIYETEGRLLDANPHLEFDFYVIAQNEQSNISPDAAECYVR